MIKYLLKIMLREGETHNIPETQRNSQEVFQLGGIQLRIESACGSVMFASLF